MGDASLLLAARRDWRECVRANDRQVATARTLCHDLVTGVVRITEQDWVTIFHSVTDEALQCVVWSVVDVAHKSVQPFVAGYCPLRHLSSTTAYWP